MHCTIFTIFVIITVIGFFLSYTNDFSKDTNTFIFNFKSLRKMKSVGNLILGLFTGLLLNPKPYNWEILTKEDGSKHISKNYVYLRIFIGILVILVYTYRNFKNVVNLYDKISNSENQEILEDNNCYYPDAVTFWTSSFTRQLLQLIIGVILGITTSSIFTKENELRININDIILGILCFLFVVLIAAQQYNARNIVTPEIKAIIQDCSNKIKELFAEDKSKNKSTYTIIDVITNSFDKKKGLKLL